MKLLTALAVTAALLVSAQTVTAGSLPIFRSKSVCLAELKAANKAKRAPKLRNCNFKGVSLRGAKLAGADLSGAMLYEADFTRANLRGANLANAKIGGYLKTDFTRADLRDIDWTKVESRLNAFFGYANLSGVNWSGKDLSNGSLQYTNLSNADLTGAGFYRAYLGNANLTNTKLLNANFTQADLDFANLSGATDFYPTETSLTGATMPDGTIYP